MAPLRRTEQLRRSARRLVFPALASAIVAACTSTSPGTPGDPPCVQGLSTTCQAEYDPPTFDTLYTKLFAPTCASGSGTCHTPDAAKGGLVFSSPDDAYARLVDNRRVVPGDPGCSLIMKRLTSTDPTYHMPPGSVSILPGEECTIVEWIAAGAKR